MSTNLYWKKVQPTKNPSLSPGLKWAFQRVPHDYPLPRVLTEADIPFLVGIAAAQDDNETRLDCQRLIDAIHENPVNGVEIWVE